MAAAVGIAVFGTGRIGHLHAVNAARAMPGARLVGVADTDLSAANRAIEAARGGRAVADYRDLLADPQVQAVVICTPTESHARIMREAADAGKHILCEKPIALTLEETRAAIDAVAARGVLLGIGFNRRYDPAYLAAKRALEAGEIGEPWIVKLVGRDPRPASLSYLAGSGGLFKDQAIHEFDLACWLLGKPVEWVSATGSVLVDPLIGDLGDVDTALTTLQFQGGALALVDNCRQAVYGYDVRAEIHGSSGKLIIGHEARTSVTLLTPNSASHDHVDWFLDRFADAFRDELIDFVECVRTGRQPRAGGEDGYAALRIAVAAGRSHRERRAIPITEVISG